MESLCRTFLLATQPAIGLLLGTIGVVDVVNAADAGRETLSEVIITARGLYSDGATPASGGAYVPKPAMGPFGEQDDRDTPFSTLSIPQLIIQDQQAHTAADLLRNDPSVVAFEPAVGRAQSYTIRGFGVGPTYGFYKDGLDLLSYTDPAIEAIERVDVLKGAAAAFYGFAEPGGLVQFASKLPLDTSFAKVRAGFISDGSGTAQVDAGTRVGDFGVRANGYFQDGDVGIDNASRSRQLEALSGDWRPRDDLRVWLNGEHNETKTTGGNPALFYSGAYATIPVAPDSTNEVGQPWTRADISSSTVDGGIDFDSNGWQLHGAAGYAAIANDFLGLFDNPTLQANGNFGVAPLRGHFHYYNSGYRASLAKAFQIGSATNTITLVANGSRHSQYIAQGLSASLGLSNLYDPRQFPTPTPKVPATTSLLVNRLNAQILTDRLDVGPLTLLAGAIRSAIDTTTHSLPSEKLVSRLAQDKTTPLGAVLYHPWETVTFYGSFLQALQPGQTAPSTGVTNPLQVLPPFTGNQYEAGAKVSVTPALEIKGALFQVEEANAVINSSGAFSSDGTQRNRGLEMTVTGRVLPSLTLFGGFTTFTAKINTANGQGYATTALHTPEHRANLYAEWDVPYVPQLTLIGGVFYVSDQIVVRNSAASVANGLPSEVSIPSYTTGDIGLRYAWEASRTPLTLSLYVSNIANKGYFVSSGSTLILGDPRSIRLTLGASF